MIRVDRGQEPPALVDRRREMIPKAVALFNQNGATSEELRKLKRYDDWKEVLFLRQHKKCAYCERRRDLDENPLEHFRPKNGAWRHERGQRQDVDEGHYWWLMWTWDNHLFACNRCNGKSHKGNYFQVVAGTKCAEPVAPIFLPNADPLVSVTSEQALFVDPASASVDPITLLWWEPVESTVPPRLWVWTVRWPPGDDRGRVTALNLKLDELADEVADHIRDNILSRVETVKEFANMGHLAIAQTKWGELVRDKLQNPQASFREPTWKALTLLVLPADLARWGLTPPPRP